jgi:hypothetical protein
MTAQVILELVQHERDGPSGAATDSSQHLGQSLRFSEKVRVGLISHAVCDETC